MDDMFSDEEYRYMEDDWYESMVDSVYEIAEELDLKNWDE